METLQLSCNRCEFKQAYDDGHEEYFFENCSPAACVLNRRLALPRAELWARFLQLWNWKEQGLVSVVDKRLVDFPDEMIEAFLDFRRGYDERMADNRKKAEERDALRRAIDAKKNLARGR